MYDVWTAKTACVYKRGCCCLILGGKGDDGIGAPVALMVEFQIRQQ